MTRRGRDGEELFDDEDGDLAVGNVVPIRPHIVIDVDPPASAETRAAFIERIRGELEQRAAARIADLDADDTRLQRALQRAATERRAAMVRSNGAAS